MVLTASFAAADNREVVSYDQKSGGLSINSKYVISNGKTHIFFRDTVTLKVVNKFYGHEGNTDDKEKLTPSKKVLDKGDFFYNTAKKAQSMSLRKSDTIVYIVNPRNDTVAILEPFNPDVHKEFMFKQMAMNVDFSADTVNVNDVVKIGLSLGNQFWQFEGEVMLGDTRLDSLEIAKDKLNFEFKVPELEGEKEIYLQGCFKHDEMGFHAKKSIGKLYVSNVVASSPDEPGISVWYILVIVIIAAIVIVVVIYFVKKGLPGKKDDGKDACDSKSANGKKQSKEEQLNEIKKELVSAEKQKSELESKYKVLKKDFDKVQAQVNTIKEECDRVYNDRYSKLQTEKERVDKERVALYEQCMTLSGNVKSLEQQLANAEEIISAQEKEMTVYKEKVTFVPFAESYCNNIMKLISIAGKVANEAVILSNSQIVDDPWHILKAISKYSASVWGINMVKFLSEVEMVCSAQVVLKGTLLARYGSDMSADELENSLKNYFFNSYLDKFINALVVFNESMAGIDGLVKGISNSDTEKFRIYREEINEVLKALGITVLSVKLFDDIGQKLDLQVEVGDFGNFNPGTILEIGNCIVYLTGGNKPEAKIKVKVQE